MNSIFRNVLLILCCLGVLQLQAQNCSNCTLTISTTVATPQVAGPGVTICVTASGVLTGDILVNGGALCNEGQINSTNIAINSGNLLNHGTINGGSLGLYGGSLTNAGTLIIDSLGQDGASTTLTNDGTMDIGAFALRNTQGGSPGPQVTNNDTLIADSIGIFDGTFLNHGRLEINFDFGLHANGSFENHDFMWVKGDFGNHGSFFTACVIAVENDWANHGDISGPTDGSCGGFIVDGLTGNYGNFGTSSGQSLDMCDTGLPTGFDGNTGNLNGTVTYCSCNNMCNLVYAEEAQATKAPMIRIYPNPMVESATLEVLNKAGKMKELGLYDARGVLVRIYEEKGNKIEIRRGGLPAGMYFYRLKAGHSAFAGGKLMVR